MRQRGAAAATVMFAGLVTVVAACSGGTSSSSSTPALAASKGALEAARACRMWTEVIAQATKTKLANPTALDGQSAAVSVVATQAGNDDPRWGALATDVAGANDFKSAAMADIANRITTDCRQVPAGATKTVAGEPDPFTTTTTTGVSPPSTG